MQPAFEQDDWFSKYADAHDESVTMKHLLLLQNITNHKYYTYMIAAIFQVILTTVVYSVYGKLRYFDRKNTSVMLIFVESCYWICNQVICVLIYAEM